VYFADSKPAIVNCLTKVVSKAVLAFGWRSRLGETAPSSECRIINSDSFSLLEEPYVGRRFLDSGSVHVEH